MLASPPELIRLRKLLILLEVLAQEVEDTPIESEIGPQLAQITDQVEDKVREHETGRDRLRIVDDANTPAPPIIDRSGMRAKIAARLGIEDPCLR